MSFLKKNISKILAFISFLFLIHIWYVYAEDVVAEVFSAQTSSASGSNNSRISVWNYLSYINKRNNSTIIWNYLSGYYYDDFNGFFKTNWSTNPAENVSIIGSIDSCGSSYGYKLWGYSYNDQVWFVDFDYSPTIFVYYCVDDNSLHGYGYSTHVWFQNFEWITFTIEVSPTTPQLLWSSTWFINGSTSIWINTPVVPIWQATDSNVSSNTIQADLFEFDSADETLFYIIK